jgi:hypothetical protein
VPNNFELALRTIEVGTLLAGLLMYFREQQRWREEVTELQWKILEQLALLTGDNGVMRGFRTRSGRFVRPRSSRFDAGGTA